MTPIQVVGVGLDGRDGLSPTVLGLIDQATVLVGSPRHLGYFPTVTAARWPLGNLQATLNRLRQWLIENPDQLAVVMASGDPLWFGLGRLLLEILPAESLTFHPHLSSVQLAFNRLKLPWQGATLISAHGRSPEELVAALRRGDSLIAVLTDPTHTPGAIGQLMLDLGLPHTYALWVCENLGGEGESIHHLTPETVRQKPFAALNVVILQRAAQPLPAPETLPLLGLPDSALASFSDRPGLITKRDIRIQILADLALQPGQTVWDIGAGTGSVSLEINRLCPTSQVYALEKTLAGYHLIQQNQQRLGNENLHPIHGTAPQGLGDLPDPDRIFIGGSGGNLVDILDLCAQRLRPPGRIVLAIATLEHLSTVLTWVNPQSQGPGDPLVNSNPRISSASQPWQISLRQIQVQHSVQVGPLTRWQPLTPITVATLTPAANS